jgi:hypothetical protein
MERKIFVLISSFWLIIYLVISTYVILPQYSFTANNYNTFNLPLIGTSVMTYLLLIPLFLMYYFCVYNVSASYKIVDLIQKNDSLSFNEIKSRIPDNSLIIPRLNALIEDNYIRIENDRYYILPIGSKIVRLIKLYGRFLGWKKGG